MHPFIHLGYGFEFGIPGQVAEGELAFSIFQPHTPILNRGRSGIHRRPSRRPDRVRATFVLYQVDWAWYLPLWPDIQVLAYSYSWREAADVRFFPSAP
jgi:hypothetical protein